MHIVTVAERHITRGNGGTYESTKQLFFTKQLKKWKDINIREDVGDLPMVLPLLACPSLQFAAIPE